MKAFIKNVLLVFVVLSAVSCSKDATKHPVTLQLNWLHDPTFSGEYLLSNEPSIKLKIREGGPNIFPIGEVASGRADIAVVGADIFLQALGKDYKEKGGSDLVAFFVDFQRNPVGWILHPDAAEKAGLGGKETGKELNQEFFKNVVSGKIQVGDKRGTETTSIWIQWKAIHGVPDEIKVVPVGFDTSVVLGAPMLAYPVYLNEEPYKLGGKIGRPVVVLDPADDGVRLYGNVLVTTRKFLNSRPEAISAVQTGLRNSWSKARANPDLAREEVAKHYKGVSSQVLTQQINKTLDFVFFGDEQAGSMNVSVGGRWEKTLKALQKAGLVEGSLTLDYLKEHLHPVQ